MALKPVVKSVFETLSSVDVSRHTEKKGNFTYLSWAWAWGIVKKNFPEATFRYRTFQDNQHNTLPFMRDTKTWTWVMVMVKIGSIELEASMPVLDHRNKPVAQPDAFQVNTAQQRALAKACALHGLGLHIYAGEDLPITENEELSKEFERIKGLLDEQDSKVTLAKIWTSNQKTINELNTQQVTELQNYYKKKLNAIKAA